MRIFLLIALLVVTACGPAISQRDGAGGGGAGHEDRWQIKIENSNWRNAKVYLISPYSDSGFRVSTVTGLTRTTVKVPHRGVSFRLMVKFLASDEVWVSDILAREPCMDLRIMNYVPATRILPCWDR